MSGTPYFAHATACVDDGVSIGDDTKIWHFSHIMKGTTIGKNCNIAQGVTIAQANRGKNEGVPVIGDEVWIGINATIVGNIHIGNDVLIAPLSYVNFDIPDNAVVMGNPAKIINYNTSAVYIKNINISNLLRNDIFHFHNPFGKSSVPIR